MRKMLKHWVGVVAVAFGALWSGAPAPARVAYAQPAPSTVTLNDQVYSNDSLLVAEHCIIAANAHVRVLNGATLSLNCDLLEVRGPATLDGKGATGTTGAQGAPKMPDWNSGGSGPARRHADYLAAGSDVDRGSGGGQGGIGGRGGSFQIRYRDVIGAVDAITALTAGGDGGAGGPGGRGRKLWCGEHGEGEYKFGPSGPEGPRGPAGPPGAWSIKRE